MLNKIQDIAVKHFSQDGIFNVLVKISESHLIIEMPLKNYNSFSVDRIKLFREDTDKLISYINGVGETYIEIVDKQLILILYRIDKKEEVLIQEEIVKADGRRESQKLFNIKLKVDNVNTPSNPIYQASVPPFLTIDYLKIAGFDASYMIFCINDTLYIHTESYYLFDTFFKESPTKGVNKFNLNKLNKFGLKRQDYLLMRSSTFSDMSFIGNFISKEERKMAEFDGSPIICVDSELDELHDYGCYYRNTFMLIKYESLMNQKLIDDASLLQVIDRLEIIR